VAELRIEHPTVTAVLASAGACDRLTPGEATLLRTAPTEALVLGATDLDALRGAAGEPTALVDDVSDGWVAFVVTGDDAREVLARLTELEPPTDGGWTQGEVAHVPAKVIAEPTGLRVLVPAHLAAHVDERIRIDAAEVLS
jgi:hypothetical protein